MKNYTIKNYKGNIVESLKKFSESRKDMKIVRAYADGDNLKILAEELENVNEASSGSVFAVMIHDNDKFKTILGIGSSEKEAQKIIDNAKGWEHAKGNMKIVKLDLDREIDYSLYGLDFSESKSAVNEAETDEAVKKIKSQPMSKAKLVRLAKKLVLPKGWIVQKVYSKAAGEDKYTDRILLGVPLEEYMRGNFRKYHSNINSILKQLNAGKAGNEYKWEEFGGGTGGGKWYDVDIGLDYDEEEYDESNEPASISHPVERNFYVEAFIASDFYSDEKKDVKPFAKGWITVMDDNYSMPARVAARKILGDLHKDDRIIKVQSEQQVKFPFDPENKFRVVSNESSDKQPVEEAEFTDESYPKYESVLEDFKQGCESYLEYVSEVEEETGSIDDFLSNLIDFVIDIDHNNKDLIDSCFGRFIENTHKLIS